MSVVWNANIPQPTDLISTSQGQILQNNQSINSVFNDATNGVFTKYAFQDEGTIASVLDPISVLHAINGTGITFNGHPIPHFTNSVGDFPIMPDISVTTPGSQRNYFFKFGNLLVNYGAISTTTTTAVLTFPQAYTSVSPSTYAVVAMSSSIPARTVSVAYTSTTQATLTASGASGTYSYIAIGY